MPWGNITTFAGTGTPGHGGDGGPAARAALDNPFYCVFDRAGNLFVAEAGNHTVRRIEARTGRISTVAGVPGRPGFAGDGGPAVGALLHEPVALAVEPTSGDLYIVDRLNARVRKVDGRTGVITTVAGDGTKAFGGDGGPGEKAQMKEPHDCAIDPAGGYLLIADVADSRVRRLDLKTGVLTTWAGTGRKTREGDDGPVAAASIAGARALAIDPRGTTFICEREGNTIRRVDGKTGVITLYAGTGRKGYEGDDGPAFLGTFNGPKSLGCDYAGNLYIVDTENHAIRCVAVRSRRLTTVAGGHRGSDGDNGPAEKAGLIRPHGVTVGPDNALYIADSENHRIRRVAP